MILVAGDVSHNIDILRWTFRTLKRKFGEVAFTPGNHDLWIDKKRKQRIATTLDSEDGSNSDRGITNGEGDGCTNSIEKLEKILQLCIDEGVRVGPIQVDSLLVVPLLSWYHPSFDSEPAIDSECWKGIPSARKVVADYRKAKWPEPLSPFDDSVAQFIDELNDVILDFDSFKDGTADEATTILSFSHFLPRIDLIPEKRYLSLPTLHSCVGSTFLEARLRRLTNRYDDRRLGNTSNSHSSNHLHAFGHSHLSWDATLDGVRYVHVPLAYPREWEQRRRSLEIGTMKGDASDEMYPVCIWEKQSSSTKGSEVALSSAEYIKSGFPQEWLGGWWSKYYDIMPRQPHRNKELAPWAARRFRLQPGGLIENFDHIWVEKRHKLQHPSYGSAGTGNWYKRADMK